QRLRLSQHAIGLFPVGPGIDDDIGPSLGEFEDDCLADVATRAGHENSFAGKVEILVHIKSPGSLSATMAPAPLLMLDDCNGPADQAAGLPLPILCDVGGNLPVEEPRGVNA